MSRRTCEPGSVLNRERGSAAVEAAVLAPGLLLLIGLTILGGRISVAGGTVEEVAAAAARQASLTRSGEQARRAATDTANAGLAAEHLPCTHTSVTVDTAGFTVPVGQPAQVRVEITCQVRLSDLGLPGLPGRRRLEAAAVSPLDNYRARTP